jgi:hypothetical protein
MTVEATGAWLSREAVQKGYGTAQAGSLFVHITRHGADWALELCDETAIGGDVVRHWAAAVGAPDIVLWRSEAHGRVWRCEWTGAEEPAADGPRATWIGGKHE